MLTMVMILTSYVIFSSGWCYLVTCSITFAACMKQLAKISIAGFAVWTGG